MPNLRSVNSQKKDIIWTYLDKLYFITWAKATDQTVYTGYQTNSIFITSEDLEDGFQRDSMRNEETDSLNCSVSAIISIHFPVLFFSLTSYECWSSLGHSLWSFYLPDLVVSFHQNVKRILKCIYPDQTSLLNSRFLCSASYSTFLFSDLWQIIIPQVVIAISDIPHDLLTMWHWLFSKKSGGTPFSTLKFDWAHDCFGNEIK